MYRHREGNSDSPFYDANPTNGRVFTEYSQAVDFVERALFTYERSFIGAFNFTSGLNRLDFDRVENRPFFLALHRQVVYVSTGPPLSCHIIDEILPYTGTFNAEDASAQHLSLLDFYTLSILGRTRMGPSFTLIMSLLNQAWDNGCWMSGISSMAGGRGINIVIATMLLYYLDGPMGGHLP